MSISLKILSLTLCFSFSTQYSKSDYDYINILSKPQNHSRHQLPSLADNYLDFELINKLFLIIFYIILVIICVLGNILVILSVHTYKPLQSVQNKFIVSLALADTFVALFVMPFHIILHITNGAWIFNSVTCHFFLTTDIFLCTSSILHLLCIALDRYWSIKYSIKYGISRARNVLIMIVLAWFTSTIVSLPVIYWNTKTVVNKSINESISSSELDSILQHSSPNNHDNEMTEKMILVCDIPQDKLYRFYSSSGTFWLPLLVMTFVYIQIFLETRRRLQERSKQVKKLANVIENSTKLPTLAAEKKTFCTACLSSNDKNESGLIQKTQILVFADREATLQKEALIKSNNSKNKKPHIIKNDVNSPSGWNRGTTNTGNALRQRQKQSLNRERRAARTLVIIMGSFIFCWLPFFVVYSLQPFNLFEVTQSLFSYLTCLGYVNSALNPIIYTVFNIDFRKSFKRLLFECVLFNSRY